MEYFVYIWHDRLRNMFYVGSHEGSTDDGYVSSSRWLNFEFKFRPSDFRRKIISFVRSRDEMLRIEYDLIMSIKDHEFGKKYYNLKIGKPKGSLPWNKGLSSNTDERVKKYGQSQSLSRTGKPIWNKGKACPSSAENGKKSSEKVAKAAMGRRKFQKSDGSVTWKYPDGNNGWYTKENGEQVPVS